MTFSILIATKDRKDELLATLAQIQSFNVECIVFDDGSGDGTSAAVTRQFPHVTLWRNENSKGYLYCRNKMLNHTKADIAISLDDDAHFLTVNTIGQIEQFFSAHPKCGLMAFRIFWGTQAPASTESADKEEIVKSFVGCGHAWRMEAWRDIPDYPEWFEFYGEENVASLDLFKRGWQVWYAPQILVWHRVNLAARAKAAGDFAIRLRRSLRSGWYAYGLFYPLGIGISRWLYSFGKQAQKIVKGDTRIIKPLFAATADFLMKFPKMRQERRALTTKQFEAYSILPDAKIYWKPDAHR